VPRGTGGPQKGSGGFEAPHVRVAGVAQGERIDPAAPKDAVGDASLHVVRAGLVVVGSDELEAVDVEAGAVSEVVDWADTPCHSDDAHAPNVSRLNDDKRSRWLRAARTKLEPRRLRRSRLA